MTCENISKQSCWLLSYWERVLVSLVPCLTQSGTYDGVESRGWSDTHSHCSAQFTSLITPNISIERPDAHLADGPTQDVAMAKLRPCLRGFTEVFHCHKRFIYK